jgi:hypothetical protein
VIYIRTTQIPLFGQPWNSAPQLQNVGAESYSVVIALTVWITLFSLMKIEFTDVFIFRENLETSWEQTITPSRTKEQLAVPSFSAFSYTRHRKRKLIAFPKPISSFGSEAGYSDRSDSWFSSLHLRKRGDSCSELPSIFPHRQFMIILPFHTRRFRTFSPDKVANKETETC